MMSRAVFSFSACALVHVEKKGNCFSLDRFFNSSLMRWFVSWLLL